MVYIVKSFFFVVTITFYLFFKKIYKGIFCVQKYIEHLEHEKSQKIPKNIYM